MPTSKPASPKNATEARQRLEEGNRVFAGTDPEGSVTFDAAALEVDSQPSAPPQQPFAAVLGCADARVPVEVLFQQPFNDLFVVRVAGNVLGTECLGSLQYAALFLDSLCIGVVIGHSSCGAVTATVDAFLESDDTIDLPSREIGALVDAILPAVDFASDALKRAHGGSVVDAPGYRDALVETAVAVHAAMTARRLVEELQVLPDPSASEVLWGVFDLASRRVGSHVDPGEDVALHPAPTSDAEVADWAAKIAGGGRVNGLLQGDG